MASIIIPTTDALDEPTVMRAIRKLAHWCSDNFQKIADNQSVIAIDDHLNSQSTNPVQNRVVQQNIQGVNTLLNAKVTEINTNLANKIDKSIYIRKIYIGTDEIPSPEFGEEGDLYIYKP